MKAPYDINFISFTLVQIHKHFEFHFGSNEKFSFSIVRLSFCISSEVVNVSFTILDKLLRAAQNQSSRIDSYDSADGESIEIEEMLDTSRSSDISPSKKIKVKRKVREVESDTESEEGAVMNGGLMPRSVYKVSPLNVGQKDRRSGAMNNVNGEDADSSFDRELLETAERSPGVHARKRKHYSPPDGERNYKSSRHGSTPRKKVVEDESSEEDVDDRTNRNYSRLNSAEKRNQSKTAGKSNQSNFRSPSEKRRRQELNNSARYSRDNDSEFLSAQASPYKSIPTSIPSPFKSPPPWGPNHPLFPQKRRKLYTQQNELSPELPDPVVKLDRIQSEQPVRTALEFKTSTPNRPIRNHTPSKSDSRPGVSSSEKLNRSHTPSKYNSRPETSSGQKHSRTKTYSKHNSSLHHLGDSETDSDFQSVTNRYHSLGKRKTPSKSKTNSIPPRRNRAVNRIETDTESEYEVRVTVPSSPHSSPKSKTVPPKSGKNKKHSGHSSTGAILRYNDQDSSSDNDVPQPTNSPKKSKRHQPTSKERDEFRRQNHTEDYVSDSESDPGPRSITMSEFTQRAPRSPRAQEGAEVSQGSPEGSPSKHSAVSSEPSRTEEEMVLLEEAELEPENNTSQGKE